MGQSRETGPGVAAVTVVACVTPMAVGIWPYNTRPWHTQHRERVTWEGSLQTTLETTNHEMHLSAPAQPGNPWVG